MKKILLTIFTLTIISVNSFAQVTNLGFESWVTGNTWDTPTGWNSFNDVFGPLGITPYTISKSNTANSGSFAIRLETKSIPIAQDTFPGLAICGTMTFDLQTMDFGLKGKALNQRPSGISGFYKYAPFTLQDTAIVAVIVTKWNGYRDTLGEGYFLGTTAVNYTSFTGTVMYDPAFNGVAPDSIIIVIFSSNAPNNKAIGSVLYVDDINLIGVNFASVEQFNATEKESYGLFPNPASDVLQIQSSKITPRSTIVIYDAAGREVSNTPIVDMNTSVSLNDCTNGLYFYRISNASNQLIQAGKINVVK